MNQNQASTSSCLLISTAFLAPHSLGHHVIIQHGQTQNSASWTLLNLVHASNLLTTWSWVLLGNIILRQQSGNFQLFMETGISLSCSQKPANSPILKQIIPIHYFQNYWFTINFNIILTSITSYFRLSISFRFHHQTPSFLPRAFAYLLNWVTQIIHSDQKIWLHLMITAQKTRKNILNSFKHLPW
jgi:hypothetical protein